MRALRPLVRVPLALALLAAAPAAAQEPTPADTAARDTAAEAVAPDTVIRDPVGAPALLRPAAGERRTITLDEAVRIALDRNTSVRRAQVDVGLGDALAHRERMDFLPSIQVSSGATRSFGRSFSQQEGAILSETSDFFGLDVSADLQLFNGFEKYASLRQAGLEEDASRLTLERTRQDVVFQVVQGYATLLENRGLAEVRREELAAQERLLEQVRGLAEVGRVPVSDLYQQQAARAEAEAALLTALREVEVARTQLLQHLQLDPLGDYEFEAPALQDTTAAPGGAAAAPGDTAYSLPALLDSAMSRRADLRALERSVDASREGVQVAAAGYWPSLSLSFGYGSDWSSEARQAIPGTGSDPRLVTIAPEDGAPVTFPVPGTGADPEVFRPTLIDQLDARRGGSVAISLSLPLFDRLQTSVAVQQAEAQVLTARYDLQDRQQLIALQVRQAVLDHRIARAQVRAARERLQAARQARDAALRRYELGAATLVEVAQANSAYVAARSARVTAGYDLRLARQLIEYHTGTLDPDAPMAEDTSGDGG